MIFLIITVVAGGLLLLFFNAKTHGIEGMVQGDWIQFYAKGKDSGFSFKELELLRRLAVKSQLEDPTALFWSQQQLDRCIKQMVRLSRESGEDKDQGTQEFLSKLYDYRKKIELEKPKTLYGITDTRQLLEEQRVRVLLSGTGVFSSYIIKNTRDYLTIARPAGPNLPQSFHWKGTHVSIYFWRNEDAGYVFDTDVTDEVYSKGFEALQINHSASVFRTQKRKSVRIKTNIPAYLYLLHEGENSAEIETAPGLKCVVEDLSDGGCALVIGGKTAPGLKVKVQFELSGDPLSMCGTVRSVDYRETENKSQLHIEADELPLETRNHILAEVFGMIDEEESLPFRIASEQAEKMEDEFAAMDDGGEKKEDPADISEEFPNLV
ncbi:MAG: PilZ domain-containing protein [Spirochaetaceae bacterium]|jgi:c-di-GMP-binding flagellar brake protein YcgR|nr:PilZ domain-containing protein [Spirochaetaceae bacterium]